MKTKQLPKLTLVFVFLTAIISASAETIEIIATAPNKEETEIHPCVNDLLSFVESLDEWQEYLTRFDKALPETSLSKRTSRIYSHRNKEPRETIKIDWNEDDRIKVSIRYHPNSDHLESIEEIKESLIEIMRNHFGKVTVSKRNPQIVE